MNTNSSKQFLKVFFIIVFVMPIFASANVGTPVYSGIGSCNAAVVTTNPNHLNCATTFIGYTPTFGTIITSSNVASSWTITGPEIISGYGVSQSSPQRIAGLYTVTWNPVAGYITPVSQSFSLTSNGTIVFNGAYTLPPPTVNIWFSFLEKIKSLFFVILPSKVFAEE